MKCVFTSFTMRDVFSFLHKKNITPPKFLVARILSFVRKSRFNVTKKCFNNNFKGPLNQVSLQFYLRFYSISSAVLRNVSAKSLLFRAFPNNKLIGYFANINLYNFLLTHIHGSQVI